LEVIADDQDERVPPEARACLLALRDQLELAKRQTLDADRRVLAWHRESEVSRRLDDIPGVGALITTALVASVPDLQAFRSRRDLSAWTGLVPKQSSTKVATIALANKIARSAWAMMVRGTRYQAPQCEPGPQAA
jgi:transposase